jgi:Fic-DOC domain mobile mystery protein B
MAGDEPAGSTPLDPDERVGLKHPHLSTREELDVLEQINIQQGLQWLRRRRKKQDVLEVSFLRELHRRLFGEVWSWAGQFRTTEKNIGVDPIHIPVRLHLLLEHAAYWVRWQTYTPEESALRLHHRLVAIHPFANGNGRHARILADVVLVDLFQRPPIQWGGREPGSGSAHRRQAYLMALRAADLGDYGPLLTFAGLSVHSGRSLDRGMEPGLP